jgi:hypothetical protein
MIEKLNIDATKLPQSPLLYNRIVGYAAGRQVELAERFNVSQGAVSMNLTRMKKGLRLNQKVWIRFAEFYLECLQVEMEVQRYENSIQK